MYQALENTILTKSALTKYSYDQMKEAIAEEIQLEDWKTKNDQELLRLYYKCKSRLIHYKYKGSHKKTTKFHNWLKLPYPLGYFAPKKFEHYL